MIQHKIDQRSPQWFVLRAGIPTASEFHRIVTPGGKPSRQAEGYLYSLLAEYVVGHPITGPETDWMQRGQELEDEAIKAYEFQTGVETQPGGFITLDSGLVGCSPDRLVGKDGLLEIKCPKESTHVGYLLTGQLEDDYRPQLQGQLWVAERAWVDVVSYHPQMPPRVMRVERDDKYVAVVACLVVAFTQQVLKAREILNAKYGPFPEIALKHPEPEPGPGALGITDEDLERIIEGHRKEGIF
jgi:hypothetical protein